MVIAAFGELKWNIAMTTGSETLFVHKICVCILELCVPINTEAAGSKGISFPRTRRWW